MLTNIGGEQMNCEDKAQLATLITLIWLLVGIGFYVDLYVTILVGSTIIIISAIIFCIVAGWNWFFCIYLKRRTAQ